jgi:hypothetical protein
MSQREIGRRIFLNYVNSYEPKILKELYQDAFPLYAEDDPSSCAPALRAWCSRWHLCEQWVLDAALTTLRWWWWLEQNPGSPFHKAGGSGLGWQWGSPYDPVPSSEASPRGGKRHRGTEHASRHYEWLAAWHTRVHTQKSLSEALGVSLNTIRTALRKTARDIGLTRRGRW